MPQLVHHWCLAQNEVRYDPPEEFGGTLLFAAHIVTLCDISRAMKIAKAAGKTALLRFALREVEQAFPHSDPDGRGRKSSLRSRLSSRAPSTHSGSVSRGDVTSLDDIGTAVVEEDTSDDEAEEMKMFMSSLPWVRGITTATAAMNAVGTLPASSRSCAVGGPSGTCDRVCALGVNHQHIPCKRP